VCISWKIKCLILLMHGATMKLIDITSVIYIIKPTNVLMLKLYFYTQFVRTPTCFIFGELFNINKIYMII